MKKWMLMLVLASFFGACHKDTPNLDYKISGQLVDYVSGKPVPNVPLYVEVSYLECLFCNWNFTEMARDTSDINGYFDLNFRLQSAQSNYPYIKVDYFPGGYQSTVKFEGKLFTCLDDHLYFENKGLEPLSDGKFHKIAILPTLAARIVRPNIPAGWEFDTLLLSVNNMSWSGANDMCVGRSEYQVFTLNNLGFWNTLAQPCEVTGGNTVDISYTIRNGTVKKKGNFSVECAFGTTTAISLPLFE